MFCFKKLTAFGYADITLTLDNSILSDDRSILRLSFARFTRRYWEHHSYFLVLPLVICLNSGGSLASREIICVFVSFWVTKSIWSLVKSEEIGQFEFLCSDWWSILTKHRKLFNPLLENLNKHQTNLFRSKSYKQHSYAGTHRIKQYCVTKSINTYLRQTI